MKNYAKFNFTDIQAALSDAKFINFNNEWEAIGISTDTRTISKNNIFIALEGENIDGHYYIDEAIKNGATALIILNKWYNDNINNIDKLQNIPLIVVKDTLNALGELAFFHRIKYTFPVIAIAGSNGKTSTKELISTILSQKYNVLKTYKNFNNQIGVPLMMLCFDEKTEIAVIEIGTSLPGEIAILSNMLNPDLGLITNIGKEHLEHLINLEQVEIEETFLYGKLLKTGGICFINCDDERLRKYTKILKKYITYGTNEAKKECNFFEDINFIGDIIINDDLTTTVNFKIDNKEYSAKLNEIGYAIGLNSIAAIAVCAILGCTGEEIVAGLQNYSSAELQQGYARMSLQKINNFNILNDCYNANPSSMLLSIKTLSMHRKSKKHIAILGDMFELGESAHIEHINILEKASELLDEVLIIGENMLKAKKQINNNSNKIKYFNNFEEMANYMNNISNLENTTFLLKGSRGMKMETILQYL